ncbi:MAG: sigma-70 family RNA polymerase sigma factor [Verrucomicrobiota bacterium]
MTDQDRHDEFMGLFIDYQPRIYAYIRSLIPSKVDADDVLQETAAVLWRKFDQFEKGTHFDRWAFRTAFHQVRYFRQKKARERLQFGDEILDVLAQEAEEYTDGLEDTQAALERCLGKLASEDRKFVAWRFAPGGTNRVIARRIGKSESVVSRAMSRIYSSLMKCISLQLKFEGGAG